MMYLQDYEDAIADYLTNSGEDYHNWDVTGAAWEMREKFDGIDQIDPDEFIAILKNHNDSFAALTVLRLLTGIDTTTSSTTPSALARKIRAITTTIISITR